MVGDAVFKRCPAALVTPLSWALVSRWRRLKLFGDAGIFGDPEKMTEFFARAMEVVGQAAQKILSAQEARDPAPGGRYSEP